MAVKIRLKRMGRTHRPFYRVCAMDQRAPRDGRAIEELGTYDPMVPETDARAILKGERIKYWLSVGAQPTRKVAVLIKKYGADGTHLEAQAAALEKLKSRRNASIEAARNAAQSVSMPKTETPETPTEDSAAASGESTESTETPEATSDEAAETAAPAEEAKAESNDTESSDDSPSEEKSE